MRSEVVIGLDRPNTFALFFKLHQYMYSMHHIKYSLANNVIFLSYPTYIGSSGRFSIEAPYLTFLLNQYDILTL